MVEWVAWFIVPDLTSEIIFSNYRLLIFFLVTMLCRHFIYISCILFLHVIIPDPSISEDTLLTQLSHFCSWSSHFFPGWKLPKPTEPTEAVAVEVHAICGFKSILVLAPGIIGEAVQPDSMADLKLMIESKTNRSSSGTRHGSRSSTRHDSRSSRGR